MHEKSKHSLKHSIYRIIHIAQYTHACVVRVCGAVVRYGCVVRVCGAVVRYGCVVRVGG